MLQRRFTLVLFTGQALASAFALMNIGGLPATSVFGPVLLLLCVFFYGAVSRMKNGAEGRVVSRISVVTGAVFTSAYMLAEKGRLTGALENGFFKLVVLGLTAAGLFFLFYYCILFVYLRFGSCKLKGGAKERPRFYLLLFVIILFCYLPYLLIHYPAVMTPDSLNQYSQAVGITAYSNHHPWVHTMLLRLFLELGMAVTGNTYHAIAFYSVFQMCVVALTFVYTIFVLIRLGISKKCAFIVYAYFALMPYHGIMAVTIWKDVLFSCFVLLFSLVLLQLALCAKKTDSFVHCTGLLVLFVFSGLGICLFRSNGWYAFLIMAPILVFLFRRQFRFVVPAIVIVTAGTAFVKGPVMNAFHVAPPAFAESLSIPAQQIARVIANGRGLSTEQSELLNQINDISFVPEFYRPELSDPVKALITYGNQDYLEAHKGRYFRLWLELGLTYPADYLDAWIEQTKGYWFPQDPGGLTNEGISPNELGLISQPVLRGPIVVKMNEITSKLWRLFPFYGTLFSIGAFTWTAVICCGSCLLRKQQVLTILYLPAFLILLTLLIATPVSGDFRYAYPLILVTPPGLLLSFGWSGDCT